MLSTAWSKWDTHSTKSTVIQRHEINTKVAFLCLFADVNECALFAEEVCKGGFCLNNEGSYECYCRTGQYYDSAKLECTGQQRERRGCVCVRERKVLPMLQAAPFTDTDTSHFTLSLNIKSQNTTKTAQSWLLVERPKHVLCVFLWPNPAECLPFGWIVLRQRMSFLIEAM